MNIESNEAPNLPRGDKYWHREDKEVVTDALVLLGSIILGIIVVIIAVWRG